MTEKRTLVPSMETIQTTCIPTHIGIMSQTVTEEHQTSELSVLCVKVVLGHKEQGKTHCSAVSVHSLITTKGEHMIDKNLCNKTVDVETPYEIWRTTDHQWEWRVLKKYQKPSKEVMNPYARWFCAVKSPHTNGTWEYGDTYVREVQHIALMVA